jgi:hypothetical protein
MAEAVAAAEEVGHWPGMLKLLSVFLTVEFANPIC